MAISLRTKLFLDRFPCLYLGLLRWSRRNHWSQAKIVTRDSEIVIEGFPRSGNSFACSAFRKANPSVTRIGTHVHMPCQIIMATRYQIPCIVLLREPVAAVCSLIAFSMQIGDRERCGDAKTVADINGLFHYYADFYERTYKVREQVVWAPFKQVTRDFGAIVTEVNNHFHRAFNVFDQSQDQVEEIFREAPVHLGPRDDRERLKEKIEPLAQSDAVRTSRNRAEAIYNKCME